MTKPLGDMGDFDVMTQGDDGCFDPTEIIK